jgi:FAD/FMN-containing dehydrogenase
MPCPYEKAQRRKGLGLVRQIKVLLGPQGILNPGKIFP